MICTCRNTARTIKQLFIRSILDAGTNHISRKCRTYKYIICYIWPGIHFRTEAPKPTVCNCICFKSCLNRKRFLFNQARRKFNVFSAISCKIQYLILRFLRKIFLCKSYNFRVITRTADICKLIVCMTHIIGCNQFPPFRCICCCRSTNSGHG